MLKQFRTFITAAILTAVLSTPYLPIQAAGKIDDSLNAMAFARLPTCNTGTANSRATINDYSGSASANSAVTVGGGTGTAAVFCDGASWKFVAGGGAASSTTAQAFVMNAPSTTVSTSTGNITVNYATACTSGNGGIGAASAAVDGTPTELRSGVNQHTCLNFDDHWSGTGTSSPTTSLSAVNWAAGMAGCNGGAAQNCGYFYDGASSGGQVNLPLTNWGPYFTTFNSTEYAFPYGTTQTVAGLTLGSFQPMIRDNTTSSPTFGTLRLGLQFFYPYNSGAGNSGFCSGSDCAYLNWIGSGMTAGGLTNSTITSGSFPDTVRNNNALIPAAGGIVQWRQKLDNGITLGAYPGVQCSAVGGPYPATGGNTIDSNSNFEFGYLVNASGGSPSLTSFGNGQNDVAVQTSTAAPGNNFVTTGDDGVGSGNLTNWHTMAVEWVNRPASGAPAGSGQWYYYVDGVSQPLTGNSVSHGGTGSDDGFGNDLHNGIPHVETRVPTIGWQCTWENNITNDSGAFNSFHSTWAQDGAGNATSPGPFYYYLSDIQFYKRPNGT